jgi:hypothetical protein
MQVMVPETAGPRQTAAVAARVEEQLPRDDAKAGRNH